MSDSTEQNYQPQNTMIEAAFNALIIKMSKDMNFLGIFLIIGGAFSCLFIIYAVVGIPAIFAGIRLRESAESFKNYSYNNDLIYLHQAIEKQSRYFFIYKILAIVYLVLISIAILIFIIVILAGSTAIINNY